MRVLLTGGAGYIGTHTALELIRSGHDIVIADNFSNSSPEVVRRLEALSGQRIPCHAIDFCDADAVEKLFTYRDFDVVIHFAGFKAVGESVREPLKYYRNNLDATLTLLEAMERHGVKKLVFSSSATVYSIAERVPMDESMPTGCTNPYGWTKYMIEQILQDMGVAHPDWSIMLLRYFNPVGADESGSMGEAPNGIPTNLFPFITQVAIGKLPELKVYGNDYPTPDGTCLRDYIHVVDLARGHRCAMEYIDQHTGVETVNLGTGIGYSVLDIVHAFERVNGLTLPHSIVGRRPGDIAASYADASKAERLFGWKAEKTLDDMCRDAWRWQTQNPKGYQSE